MFSYEKSISGKVDRAKVWALYADVSQWSRWDKSVQAVQLFGPFAAGTQGVMQMTDGSSLPFELSECVVEESFAIKSQLGPVTVIFDHFLQDNAIKHTVSIEGGEENFMKGMGESIAAGIPASLQALISA